jgi:D-alanyl-D-alanine carboxypeptidase (penicillin-binding protein 5/6)
VIYDLEEKSILEGDCEGEVREIASMTKVVTFLTVWGLIERFRLNYQTVRISVTQQAAATIGTSARLTAGTWMTILDLLYGLMLPSGNDAALLLAQTFGLLLQYADKHKKTDLEMA